MQKMKAVKIVMQTADVYMALRFGQGAWSHTYRQKSKRVVKNSTPP